MISNSCDIEQNRLNLVSLGPFFAGDIMILHMCIKNHYHLTYGPWDTVETDIFFCHFGPFCVLSSPWRPGKSKFWKMKKKNAWRYHVTQMQQKSWLYATLFLRYDAWRMQFLFFVLGYFLSHKWHTEVGVPPKKIPTVSSHNVIFERSIPLNFLLRIKKYILTSCDATAVRRFHGDNSLDLVTNVFMLNAPVDFIE